jgi:hypothetical protein
MFQRLRNHAKRLLHILLTTLAVIQTHRHTHALQHLNVIVDLKRIIKVEQVLGPEAMKIQPL